MNWLERLLLAIARHGRIECSQCGTFNKKGCPCRCFPATVVRVRVGVRMYDAQGKQQPVLTMDQLSELIAEAYEAGVEAGYSNTADKTSRDEYAKEVIERL